MTQKLSFSVEDAKIISENPNSNFAVLSLDFFASGENLHDMYVSEETLMRTADTIKNCPLVWKYDEKLDDVYTHDKDEVPCGFVPESSKVESRKLEDGRTMLSVIAYVWKRYTGALLGFFRRDGGKKPVSVEMNVYDMKPLSNGLTELLDFRYEGITVLGSFVTPAIPLASATVLSFSKIKDEYNEDFEKEFSNKVREIEIPKEIKENAEKGLQLRKQYDKGGNSVELAFARYLTEKNKISPEKIKYIIDYFSKQKEKDFQQTNPPSAKYISSLLLGGTQALNWAKEALQELDEEEKEMVYGEIVTFPYKSIGDMNPALKGISPPITVSQGNEIARQAESIGISEEKNGWAIAISSFKKTHVVKDGKWVKKSNKTEMAMEKLEKQEETSAETIIENSSQVEEETTETTEVEMAEESPSQKLPPEEEEEEEEEKEEKKEFEFPKNMSLEMMEKLFAEEDEEDEEVKMAKAEMSSKGSFAAPEIMMAAMFAKMCKMAEAIAKMAEAEKVYMEKNAELEKFKAEVESQRKNFEVEKTIQELSEKVVLPQEAKDEMLAEAEKFSLENLEEWKIACKAKSFDFATRESNKTDVVEIGLPFTASSKKSDSLWAS